MTELNIQQELKEIRRDLKDLKLEVTQYKSFVGGILWTFMALSTALTFLYSWAKEIFLK